MLALYVITFLLLAGALAFVHVPALAWLAGMAAWVAAGAFAGITNVIAATLLAIVCVLPPLVLAVKPLRRALISRRIFAIFRKILPQMSSTERDAIEVDTVWWDAELFSGRPRWDTLLAHGAAVAIADLNQTGADAVAEAIRGKGGKANRHRDGRDGRRRRQSGY